MCCLWSPKLQWTCLIILEYARVHCAGENACETRTAREGPNDPESSHWGSQSACLNLLQLKEICYHLCNGITKFKVCKFIPTNIILSPSPPLWRRCGALEVAQRKDAKSGDRTPRWGRCFWKNYYCIEKTWFEDRRIFVEILIAAIWSKVKRTHWVNFYKW